MNKKCLVAITIAVASISTLTGCSGTTTASCEHNYVETKVNATCTTEGYSSFTCSKCGDSYKGDTAIPLINHSGIGKCSVCNAKFDTIWKDFILKKGTDNSITVEGKIALYMSFTETYDCMLFALTSSSLGNYSMEESLTLAYNAYDQKWSWLYKVNDDDAYGSFSQWSSKSSSLNCTIRNGSLQEIDGSTLLSLIKNLYNPLVNAANDKLKQSGYNITMANLGLEN